MQSRVTDGMVVWRVVTRSASDGGSRNDCEGGVLVYENFVGHTYKENANSVVIQRVVNVGTNCNADCNL